MEKRKSYAFGKDVYLLGKDKEGILYWLEAASWDCDWYWGLGYIVTYTNNKHPGRSKDINSHQHFNSLFFNCTNNGFDNFKNYLTETPFNNNEIWRIMEIMKTLYTLKEYSETLHRGGSHYISNPCKDIIKNDDEYNRINKVVIPTLNKELYRILSEKAQ